MFSIKQVITLEIEGSFNFTFLTMKGGGRFFLVVKAVSEQSEFGVDVDELDKTIDQGTFSSLKVKLEGLKVPSVLVTIKNYLKENGGFQLKGIFKQQGI